MDLLLQWTGGWLYLLNKAFLSVAERTSVRMGEVFSMRWRIAAWAAYLAGLPPWIAIFAERRDWIATSVEAAGLPSMLIGLLSAIRGQGFRAPRWLDGMAVACIGFGFSYSLYDRMGFSTVSQWLETGLVTGYLIGTYLVAKRRPSGYLWFFLMNVCCGTLMWKQNCRWLAVQQLVSLLFVAIAYRASLRTNAS